MDADGDGKVADLVLASGTSRQLGSTTTHSVLEWSGDSVLSRCPNGNPGFQSQFVAGSAVIHTEHGDLLLIRFDKGTTCIDSATNTAGIKLAGTVVGGTGRFANAKGTVEIHGIAIPEVAFDESG